MKVYDVITLFNELDLLDARLNILDSVVDYFVINEATTTFTGQPKDLYYQDNKDRFKKFEHKIIHNVFKENNPAWNQWDRDRIHKNASMEVLVNCDPDDIIMYSDADEIPNPDALDFTNNFDPETLYICHQDCYYYYLNAIWQDIYHPENFWRGTKYSSWALLKKHSVDTFRDFGSYYHQSTMSKIVHVPQAGWHFSFLGGADKIKYKIQSYGHQELNIPQVTDNIQKNIDELKDPFFRSNFYIRLVPITKETHPAYIVDNQEKFAKYIKQ